MEYFYNKNELNQLYDEFKIKCIKRVFFSRDASAFKKLQINMIWKIYLTASISPIKN